MTDNVLYTDDGGEIKLPTKREVCWRCDGRGTYTNPSIDGNGITSDEWSEWDDDEKEGYLAGRYDVTCEECHGCNVIEVVDEDRLSPDQLIAWRAQVEDIQSSYRISEMERRMGA